MGVPNFYSWLVRRYPMAQYDFNEFHNQKTDFLFLDMNQVIYKCATHPGTLFSDQLQRKEFEDVWIAIFDYINKIIDLVDPQQLLFIAFDGGAPRAKMNQQRQRRFQSAQGNQKLEQEIQNLGYQHENDTYRNNQITAGTEFMEKLNQQIQFFVKRKFIEDQRWQKLKVIYSGCDVPGEGEHKIMDFIRNLIKTPTFSPDWTYMVYGADADLIMLGLSTHLKYFNILREKMPPYSADKISSATKRTPEKVEFQVINLQIVRQYMDLEYRDLKYKKPYNVNKIIDDFLLICMFIGNDFLPRVFCFDIKQGTLELLILLFKQYEEDSSEYLNDNGKLNWKEIISLLKRLSAFEVVAIEKRTKELEKFIKENKAPQQGKLINKELEVIKSLQSAFQNGNSSAARRQFYKEKCNIDIDVNEKEIKSMVKNYLEGIQFVLKYYYEGLPSWDWYYNFYYSPLCGEMYTYLSEQNETLSHYNFERGQPNNQFFNLLCILPASSSALLPAPYRSLIDDMKSPLRSPFDYFPQEFEIDPFGAVWEHQFIAKIPFLDKALLTTVFSSIDENLLNESEKVRRQVGTTKLYKFDESQKYQVKSLFPEIYKDFEVSILVDTFDFMSLQQCSDLSGLFGSAQNNQLCRAPSISLIKLKQAYLKEMKDFVRKSKVLTIEHESHQNTNIIDKLKTKKQLWVYGGLPVQYDCKVLAVLTKDSIHFAQDYDARDINNLYDIDYSPQDHRDCYDILKSNLMENMKVRGVDSYNLGTIVIVMKYTSLQRQSNGSLRPSNGQEINLPLEWISFDKQYDFKFSQINPQHLPEEFPHKSKILLFTPNQGEFKRFNGCVCEIQKTIPATDKLIVSTIKKLPPLKSNTYTSNETYYAVTYVAQELDVSLDVLLYVLGSVKIVHKKEAVELTDGVDVGLNIIKMHENLLVPELARLPNADSQAVGYVKFLQYKNHLELSLQCVKLLVQYKKKIPQLFEYLDTLEEKALQRLSYIRIHDVFLRDVTEPQKLLYEIYIWILRHPTSQYQLGKTASATIISSDIKALDQLINPAPHQENCDILVNAGHVYREYHSRYLPPFYSDHPPVHQLGSRVINLNSTSSLKARFGATGTVIGLYDQGEMMIEVYWDEPQIGFSVGFGRSPQLRSSIVRFNDILNLSCGWSELLVDRDVESLGWNNTTTIFSPQFKNKAIDSKTIHKKILKLKKIDDPFLEINKTKTE